MHDIILKTAKQTGSPFVDVRRRFEELSPGGIPGDELLVDHVHPSIRGHQLIAQMLLEEMVDQKFLTPEKKWEVRQQELYRRHFQSLGLSYFEQGKQRLEALRLWTQGRARNALEPGTER